MTGTIEPWSKKWPVSTTEILPSDEPGRLAEDNYDLRCFKVLKMSDDNKLDIELMIAESKYLLADCDCLVAQANRNRTVEFDQGDLEFRKALGGFGWIVQVWFLGFFCLIPVRLVDGLVNLALEGRLVSFFEYDENCHRYHEFSEAPMGIIMWIGVGVWLLVAIVGALRIESIGRPRKG